MVQSEATQIHCTTHYTLGPELLQSPPGDPVRLSRSFFFPGVAYWAGGSRLANSRHWQGELAADIAEAEDGTIGGDRCRVLRRTCRKRICDGAGERTPTGRRSVLEAGAEQL